MRNHKKYAFTMTLLSAIALTAVVLGGYSSTAQARKAENLPDFESMFSMPFVPNTGLGPDTEFRMAVPTGKKVVITDVYLHNFGDEQGVIYVNEIYTAGTNQGLVRYTFRVAPGEDLIINFSTGLRLGDYDPSSLIEEVVIRNEFSTATIIPRINGYFVD